MTAIRDVFEGIRRGGEWIGERTGAPVLVAVLLLHGALLWWRLT